MLDIQIHNQDFQLFKEKALFWKQTKTLVLSDIHLGKAEFFQSRGVPIASEVHDEDLRRIKKLIEETSAERMLLLGDVFHTNQSFANLEEKFRSCLQAYSIPWIFVSGNHDSKKLSALSKEYPDQIDQYDVLMEDPFVFIHEHEPEHTLRTDRFYFSGHIHPVVKLAGGNYNLRLPCFWKRPNSLVLPSFGSLTGGYAIQPSEGDELFAVTDQSVRKI